jgi:hypothetical protein
VFGGVDCQVRVADLIEDDLKYRLPESCFKEEKSIKIVKTQTNQAPKQEKLMPNPF